MLRSHGGEGGIIHIGVAVRLVADGTQHAAGHAMHPAGLRHCAALHLHSLGRKEAMDALPHHAVVDELIARGNHALMHPDALHRAGSLDQLLTQGLVAGNLNQIDLAHHAHRVANGRGIHVVLHGSFGNHHIGFDYNYYNRREDGDATIMNTLFQSRAWDFVAPGFFKEAEFSANPIFYIERYYHAHAMGGGVQYGFKNSHWNILLSGNYQQRVEDINNEQLHEDPENLRKIIGTVKEDIYTGKLVANYTFNNGNMLSLNASYQDKSVDGIEYYQKFDSSIEVNGWVINAKYTTSNTSKVDKEVKLDYIVNDGNVYKWWFGVNYANRTNDWCYYLPQANQDVTNNIYGAFASRHIPFKKNHSLTISFNGGFSSNSEAFMKYEGEGTQPENAGWTDFTLRDFNYLTTNYTKFGGELSYAYSGFRKNESMSLFLTVALDHYTPGTDLFTNRTITNFTLGIAF